MTFPKLLVYLTLPLYVLDQIAKFWTVGHFASPPSGQFSTMDPPLIVVDGFFYLTRVHNQGVAFGMGNGTKWAPVVFLLVPLIALTLIRFFWKKGTFSHPFSKIAVALLLCGILGNLTDRLVQGFLLHDSGQTGFWGQLSLGYVVDFIAIKLPFYDKISPSSGGWWPFFNVADSCICVAALMLFIGGLCEDRKKAEAE